MGECPDWFPLIRAARYLGVPPWELAAMPVCWRNWALIAQDVENTVQKEAQERAVAAQKARGLMSGGQ